MVIMEEGKQTIEVKRELLASERLYSIAGALLSSLPQTAEILTNIAIEVVELERKAEE